MIELLLVAERLLAEGDLERAGHLFDQVAEADPRNAIAIVGLAQVAQRKGDREIALAYARRALLIDPDEAAARRLIDELESGGAAAGDAPGAAPTAPTAVPRRSLLDRILALFGLRD